jgi:tRNA 2-thiouridine synthesizing protein A
VDTLDARGLRCPMPLVKTKLAIEGLAPGDRLRVLTSDPEAPIDIGAWAGDHGHAHEVADRGDHREHLLAKGPGAGAS